MAEACHSSQSSGAESYTCTCVDEVAPCSAYLYVRCAHRYTSCKACVRESDNLASRPRLDALCMCMHECAGY